MTPLGWVVLGFICGALVVIAHDDPKIGELEDDLEDALGELDDTRAERDAIAAALDELIAEELEARAEAEAYARNITAADRPLLRIVGGNP